MAETQEQFNDTLLGEAVLEELRETKNRETHPRESGTPLYMGKKRFASSLNSQSKRKEWMLPFLGPHSDQLDNAEPFPKNNIESARNSEEKKASKRRRHKLRHGKRRWGRGYKMLLDTDGSFDNIFRNIQVKDTLQNTNGQYSTFSGTIPYIPKSRHSESTQHLQNSVTTEGAVMDKELSTSESTSSPSLMIPQLYSWNLNISKVLPHNSTTSDSLVDLPWTIHRPKNQQGNYNMFTYLTPTDETKNGSVEEVQTYPPKLVNNLTVHEEEIANKYRNEVLLKKVVQTLVSVASLASHPANSVLNLRQRSQEPIVLPESNKRQTIKSRRTLQNPLLANSNKHIVDTKSGDDNKHNSREIHSESINSDGVKSLDLMEATQLSIDREESDLEGSDSYISHDPIEPEVGLVRNINSSPFLTLLSPGTTATSLDYRNRASREHRFSSIRKRAEARAQAEPNSDGDKFGRGEVGGIVAHNALLQTASHSPPSQASKDQGTVKHNHPTSSITDAKAGSSTECYSTNDVVVAVFLTSVLNMVVFVFVTVALCWCSLRARATASTPRSLRSSDPNEIEVEDNTEETA